MKLSKNCNIEQFSSFFVQNQKTPVSVKLIIDDIIIEVSRIILSWWSKEFDNRADTDQEIFLTNFIGYKDEINDCISLLHGQNIEVDFTNISVILKFAAEFKIPELIDAAVVWFQGNISTDTFLNMINVVSDLEKIGYKLDGLTEVIRQFIRENTEACCRIIIENFEADVRKMVYILVCDGPLIKECINLFNSKIRVENDYEYFVEKLEDLAKDSEHILIENLDGLDKLMDTVLEEVKNIQLLKRWTKLLKSITINLKHIILHDSNKEIIKFQAWRQFSKSEVLELKKNHKITEYQYAVICLDWVEVNKPPEEDVVQLYHSINQEKLGERFVELIRNMMCDVLGYNNIPEIQELSVYEYDEQCWDISKQELLGSINNETTVELKITVWNCSVTDCNKDIHSVSIKFAIESNKVTAQVIPREHINTAKMHTHDSDRYVFWCLEHSTIESICHFYTKSYKDIIAYINTNHTYLRVRCLMMKH